MASMSSAVESGTADEDQIREFYILQIQKWISTSLEEIESIDQELVLLRSRDVARQVREHSWDPGAVRWVWGLNPRRIQWQSFIQ